MENWTLDDLGLAPGDFPVVGQEPNVASPWNALFRLLTAILCGALVVGMSTVCAVGMYEETHLPDITENIAVVVIAVSQGHLTVAVGRKRISNLH